MRSLVPLFAALSFPALLSACWDLPAGDKTSVYYWSDVFLEKYADELVVRELEPGPTPLAEPRAVLLITGVTIKAKWFDPIVARLKRDGFVPYMYEPPELLSGSLFQASHDLGAVVDRVRQESGQDKIDILAECTGGVIARYYIRSLGGAPKVSRLVTFVSPQHGVEKAPWASMIADWPALVDLSPGSAFLDAVNAQSPPPSVPVTSIYTCSDEYIQPYSTSIIPGAKNIGLCDELVGHFQTFYDPDIYLIMHGALVEPTPEELAAANDPEPTEDPTDEPTDPADDPSVDGEVTEPTPGDDAPIVALPNDDGAFEPADGEDPQALDPEDPAVAGLGCAAGTADASGIALALIAIAAWLARKRLSERREQASDLQLSERREPASDLQLTSRAASTDSRAA